jgi:sugar phosphate isomerase/epimerase
MAKLGIQLIIFGKRSGEDFPGVLTDVKAAGYDGVETGYKADKTGAEVKQLLADHGLLCAGYHAGYPVFANPDEAAKHAHQMVEAGGKYLMCSGVEGWGNATRDAYLRAADVFNRTGEMLQKLGANFCYHNHQWEFYDLGNGERGMDILLANTDPHLVKFCVDVYWVACGNENPAQFITTHKDRGVYFHYKDGTFDAKEQKPITFTELGNGQVNLPEAHAVVSALNPEWITTEQDRTDGDPATSARISAEYARGVLGI